MDAGDEDLVYPAALAEFDALNPSKPTICPLISMFSEIFL